MYHKALNHHTGDCIILSYTRMTLFSITMHISLSLVALGFGALLCYVLFIILGIYLILCILLYNALILTQGSYYCIRIASSLLQGSDNDTGLYIT